MMESLTLFKELEKEVNKKLTIEIFVFPIIPGRDAFFDQPHGTKKVIRKEHITVHGKKTLIRRVYLFSFNYPDYRNIGWVLMSDINSCMICSKEFSKFLIRKRQKFHCYVCGNIVCESCLNGLVRIREMDSGYVSACSNCYWGQDEISIATNLDQNEGKSLSPTTTTIASTVPMTTSNLDFYNCYDIEEYDGPPTIAIDNSKVFPISSTFPPVTPTPSLPTPSPHSFYPRVDSLCYSDGISRWSDTGSLQGESIQPSPTPATPVASKTENDEYFSETSESERGGEKEEEEDDDDDDDDAGSQEESNENDDSLTNEQTANQAQLMLLLMSLSLANPSEMTEEEAREFNERADQIALEKLSGDDDDA